MTDGSLCLASGVLYVGRQDRTAHVRPYDLDGRPLGAGFACRTPAGELCSLGGLAVGGDHEIWIADAATNRVRAFNLFGRELVSFGGIERERDDARGTLRVLADLALTGEDEEEPALIVASGGWRRHALHVFDTAGRCLESLRPEGDSQAHFNGITRVAAHGRWLYVCEARAGRVQVFRDREFHFEFRVPVQTGRFEPVAIAPLGDGRVLVATAGANSALLLVDGAGRLLRVLAERGHEHGQVTEPGDVAVEIGRSDHDLRAAVIDRDGERVQVFTLEGRCHGELEVLPGRAL